MPKLIVSGGLVDVDEQARDTPRIDPPKPPAETESRRNLGSTVFGMAHEVGYARVSKREQNPDAQAAELRAAGCERVFVDHGESSRVTDRPQWVACLDYLRPGDTLKVRRLDRLAGSERILIETLQDLDARQVNIVSLTEPMIDTTSPMGRALFGIVAVFAQLRVGTIRENTQRGLEYARAQGRVGGRPSVMTPERIATARQLRAELHSWESIGRVLGVGASSVRRALSKHSFL
ncbi:recombinase family protein [Microbacterium imperiale]|uniref:recombinase family protein n=1 Tax=Microbacterium imperiale TaxID=33884 RepID=UPI0027DBC40F|nr:recombinase family protein [Microbacterium imperiale]MBP2420742.1 DNA invertase Pin-like site-specific DNA recombinase [Microbacterium imperiale]BFE41082.1 recombinase family protein [Microbacterium imperiale]